jgi:RNA polymerase sigma-70 factor (ECF subfamily)
LTETDETLVQKAQAAPSGDLRAFETLILRHQGGVLANCRYLTGSADDAQDLAQEVFVKAFFGLKRFEGRSKFRSWIQRIKVNHCLNFLRKRKGKTFVDVSDPATETAQELHVPAEADRQVRAADQREAIRTVLEQLSDTVRIPLVMRDLDGMSYEEIADALGIGLSAVKMRIKRGREEFRRLYGPRDRAGAGEDEDGGQAPQTDRDTHPKQEQPR